jgi:hypothetical protein
MGHTVRWDSVFYLENALEGYRYEKNHAFLPGFITIVKMMHQISNVFYLELTLLLNETFNIISMVLLYKISMIVSSNKNVQYRY